VYVISAIAQEIFAKKYTLTKEIFLPIVYKWIIFNEKLCTWFVRQNQEEFNVIKHMLRQANF